MGVDAGAARSTARLIYPQLPAPLTGRDLHQLFTPSAHERKWAPTIARTPASQVALLVQLKSFQAVGRFLPAEDIPASAIECVRHALRVEDKAPLIYARATFYRHQAAIRDYLGVTAWGEVARELAESTMTKIAEARTDPFELVNAAVDTLIRHHFELPAFIALRRLAGNVHSTVNTAQWQRVCSELNESQCAALETLLEVDPNTQESRFAELCRATGRASRKNLRALMDRYGWLLCLPDPTVALQSAPDSKVLQWADEARRLNAKELREYVRPRRLTLLLATIRHARGQVLDDLTQMLLKLARRIECKSQQHLQEWYDGRVDQTDFLIRAFRDSLLIHGSQLDLLHKIERLEALFATHGGREKLEMACAEHLQHERRNWRPFARQAFVPLRAALMRLAALLPLGASPQSDNLLTLVATVAAGAQPPYDDFVLMSKVSPQVLPPEWRPLVQDHPSDPQAFNRRQLEVVAVLELADAIKAGEVFVTGSLSYERFWDRLPTEALDPTAISAYASARGWGDDAEGFIRALKESLERQAHGLDRAIHQWIGQARQGWTADRESDRGDPDPCLGDPTGKAASGADAGATRVGGTDQHRALDAVEPALWTPIPARSADS